MGKNRTQFEHMIRHRKSIIWLTKSQYVDGETGEIIIKERVKNGEYYKLNQQINYENEGNKESKQSQQNVKEVAKEGSSETISRENVKDSPFTIITIDGKSFGTMGDYRLTEEGTIKEIRKQLKTITWNRIIQVIMLLDEMKNNLKTNKK